VQMTKSTTIFELLLIDYEKLPDDQRLLEDLHKVIALYLSKEKYARNWEREDRESKRQFKGREKEEKPKYTPWQQLEGRRKEWKKGREWKKDPWYAGAGSGGTGEDARGLYSGKGCGKDGKGKRKGKRKDKGKGKGKGRQTSASEGEGDGTMNPRRLLVLPDCL
jgi:hypothetical protein